MTVRGEQGDTGRTGIPGTAVSDRRLLFVMVWCVVAFFVLAGIVLWNQQRVSHNTDDIRQNSQMIQQLVYDQCTIHNATTVRQNGLIQRAIDAEKRRNKPNAQTLKDLRDFEGTLTNCGPKP